MASLTDLLIATQNPATRAEAEAQLQQAEQAQVDEYFTALAQEIANASKPMIARQLSGLLLKNGIASKDPMRDRELKARWVQLPADRRNLVKEATKSALTAQEMDVGKAAGQVLAKIGVIEIPRDEWPGLVPELLAHVTGSDPRARQISLITLGYLCEELVALQEEGTRVNDSISNNVLTAVVQGMRDADTSIKLEATRAFYHAVVLARKNFESQQERDFIMQMVQQTCASPGSEAVQVAAFESLVQIVTEYYDFMMPYMNVIGPLTWDTIRSSTEKVAIPAMEFWSTICDEELYLGDLVASGEACGRAPLNLIMQALPFLVPLLTDTLTKQQSEEDDETWNLARAAGTCLGLVAQVVGDYCVDQVLAFVQQNFSNPDWKFREAAVLAYGSIMEGPTSEKMRPLVEQSYPHLVMVLTDSSVAVRDTIAWTLGRIAQFHPTIVPVKQLTPMICERLQDVPRVAANICWVIQVLAEAQPSAGFAPGQCPPTTALSEFFTGIVQSLLQVVQRADADERQLRMVAYEALSIVISRAGDDCLIHMDPIVQEMLRHLSQSFSVPQACNTECQLQGYICGVLTSLVHRLRDKILHGVTPAADRIMEESIKVFVAYQAVKQAQVLQEEALLLVAAVANAVGTNFERFMPHFAPHLRIGLQRYEEVHVCIMATGVVGDLCRGLGRKINTYCDTILEILYGNLENGAVDRKIKPAIMSCFGDIALAITGDFEKYLPPVVKMLREASATKLQDGPSGNEEWVEYLNNLREGALEAYTGIIHGLRDANKLHLLREHVNAVLFFINDISEDPKVVEAVLKAAVGVVGDLILGFKQELTVHLATTSLLVKLVDAASRSTDPSLQQNAAWLRSLLQKYGAAGQ